MFKAESTFSKVLAIVATLLFLGAIAGEIIIIYIIIKRINKQEGFEGKGKEEINFSSQDKNELYLGNYQFLGSYNSCLSSGMNKKLTLSTLQNNILKGYRYLDFEVFSMKNKTVVSASTDHNVFKTKTAINELSITSVLDTIANYAFSNEVTNRNDPLFIQFRIKSRIKRVYNDIADAIQMKLSDYLLESKFRNNGVDLDRNIIYFPFSIFQGKVIIVIHEPPNEQLIENTNLYRYTNIILLPRHIIRLSGKNNMTETNKSMYKTTTRKRFMIAMPLGDNIYNFDVNFPITHGFNGILLHTQNKDGNYNNAINAFKPYAVRIKNDDVQLPQVKWTIDRTNMNEDAGNNSKGSVKILGTETIIW